MGAEQGQQSDTSIVEFPLFLVGVTWAIGMGIGGLVGPLIAAIGYFLLYLFTIFVGTFQCCFSCFENSPAPDVDVVDAVSSGHSSMWDNILAGEMALFVASLTIASIFAFVALLMAMAGDKDNVSLAAFYLVPHLVVAAILYAFGGFAYAQQGWEFWSEFFAAF
jgi:hypothetical protein